MGTRVPFPLCVLSLFALAACNQSGTGANTSTPAKPAAVAAYTYPPPVKGHFGEVNIGKFDLVDGVAYAEGKDTVIYVTEKPIASPIVAASTCAITQARALALLRNSGYVVVSMNAAGAPDYFEAGTPFNGQMIDRAGRNVKISGGKTKDAHVSGTVADKSHGKFDFDLPVADARPARAVTQDELFAAYTSVRRAAIAKDLKAMLSALGFEPKAIEAIRGLAGIDADFASHADRFLDPGAPEEPDLRAMRVGGRGKNSKGAAFINYYTFATCGDKLVLVKVGENPQ